MSLYLVSSVQKSLFVFFVVGLFVFIVVVLVVVLSSFFGRKQKPKRTEKHDRRDGTPGCFTLQLMMTFLFFHFFFFLNN